MTIVNRKNQKMPMALQAQKIRLDIINAGKDPYLFDLSAHMDSTLSFRENRHNIAGIMGYQINEKNENSGSVHRQGYNPLASGILTYSLKADDYNRQEQRRRAAEKRRLRGPQPRKKVSRQKFNEMETLAYWQSDPWPFHPTEGIDRARTALPPGRRLSKNGRIYYERRRNRSDMPGTGV